MDWVSPPVLSSSLWIPSSTQSFTLKLLLDPLTYWFKTTSPKKTSGVISRSSVEVPGRHQTKFPRWTVDCVWLSSPLACTSNGVRFYLTLGTVCSRSLSNGKEVINYVPFGRKTDPVHQFTSSEVPPLDSTGVGVLLSSLGIVRPLPLLIVSFLYVPPPNPCTSNRV